MYHLFARLNFRDLKNFAKLKSREEKLPQKLKTHVLVPRRLSRLV